MTVKRRVVHVLGTSESHGKGIAHIVSNLAAHLDASIYSVSVVFMGKDGPLGDHLRSLGIDVGAVCWTGGWRDIRGATRFVRAVRHAKPDIIHLHAGGLSPRFAARATGSARVVVHFHSLAEESGNRNGKLRPAVGADLIIANSEATASGISGNPIVVYPGVKVPPRRRPRVDTSSPIVRIGVAARLAPVKGIEHLIAAAKLLEREFPKLILEIAGTGVDRPRLHGQAIAAEIADRVRFIGWKDDITALMSEWDVYVQPSLAEGFGIAALEAMAAGLPVVATRVGGLCELVEDGTTGWLVNAGDPKALAHRIGSLIREPDMRLRMGNAGRQRAATRFSLEREASSIQSAYERLLA